MDIRRDNLLQQLLFKALFELSSDRLEYLALLTARPLPAARTATQPASAMSQVWSFSFSVPLTYDRARQWFTDERRVQVWVEAVYRTSHQRTWVPAVYRTVYERVSRPPVKNRRCSR